MLVKSGGNMDGVQSPEQPVWQSQPEATNPQGQAESWLPKSSGDELTGPPVEEVLDAAANEGLSPEGLKAENPLAAFTEASGAEVVLPTSDGVIPPKTLEITPTLPAEAQNPQPTEIPVMPQEVAPEATIQEPTLETAPEKPLSEITEAPIYEAEAEEVVYPDEVAQGVEALYSQAEGQLVNIQKAVEVLDTQEKDLNAQLAGIVEKRNKFNASAEVIKRFLDRRAEEKSEGIQGGLE
jgi:hypothetical protein